MGTQLVLFIVSLLLVRNKTNVWVQISALRNNYRQFKVGSCEKVTIKNLTVVDGFLSSFGEIQLNLALTGNLICKTPGKKYGITSLG